MTELLAAITTKIGATAGITNLVGQRFYLNAPPEGTAFPFLVFSVIAAPLTESYGGTNHYTARVQFSAFAESTDSASAETSALAIAAAVVAAFDGATLTVSGKTNIDTYRDDQPFAMPQPTFTPTGPDAVEKSENARNVAAAHVTYNFAVQ